MTRPWPRRARPDDDRGVAMIYALAVALVSMSLLTTMAIYTVGETRQSGKYRQMSVALAAAEGQVDLAVARITAAAASSSLPCTPTTITESTTGADVVTTTTTITYTDTSGNAVACPVPAGQPLQSAVVKAVATGPALPGTAPVRRTMQASLRIAGGSAGGSLGRAIFADSDIVLGNVATLTATTGTAPPTPSIYTNDTFQCNLGLQLPGELVAQYDVTLQGGNGCVVGGKLSTDGALSITNTTTKVGGDIAVSGSNASIVNGATIGGTVKAKGTISWTGCTSSTCTARTTVPSPTWESFPSMTWDAAAVAAWQAAGYQLVPFDSASDCTVVNGLNAPSSWLLNNFTGTQKYVMHTKCKVQISPASPTFDLGHDLAVVADQGIQFGNAIRLTSATGPHKLYLMQPSNPLPSNCSTQGVVFNNSVTFDSAVSALIFTPCRLLASNAVSMTGQIYGGYTSFNNTLALEFRQLPVPGVSTSSSGSGTGSGTGSTGYTVSVASKRESTG